MPVCLEAFGLGKFQDPSIAEEFFTRVTRYGVIREGYHGSYITLDYGGMELIARLMPSKQAPGQLKPCGADTQVTGQTVWEVEVLQCSPDPNVEEGAMLMRQCMVCNADHSNMSVAVINVINADILPTFAVGTRLSVQVCALPSLVSYHADEETVPEDPSFRRTHRGAFRTYLTGSNRGLTWMHGEVIAIRHGFLPEKPNAFLIVTIDTDFGPLEIVHTRDMVAKEQRHLIRRGSIISFQGIISADAVTREYYDGRIFDEDHHLLFIAGICGGEEAERLRAIATENVRYTSEHNGFTIEGVDAVIAKLHELKVKGASDCRVRLATVVDVHKPNFAPRLPYGVGKRCAYLYVKNKDGEETCMGLLFITLDAKNRVAAFEISQSNAYTLVYDKPHHDIDVPPHIWPRSPLAHQHEDVANAVAYAHACIEREAAKHTPTNGGLVWLKETWEYPADSVPLIFTYDGVLYRFGLVFCNGPDLFLFEIPGFFHRALPLQPEADFTQGYVVVIATQENGIESYCDEAYGVPLRDSELYPMEDFGTQDDSSPMGPLEMKCLAMQEARAFLGRNGLECLSACGYPGVGPEVWFRDAQGRACWMRVAFATTPEECDIKHYRGLEQQELPRLRANDGYLLTVHLPDFGVPHRGPRPTLVTDPLRRLALAP